MKTLEEFINESMIAEANAALEKALSKDFSGQVFANDLVEKTYEDNDNNLLLVAAIDELLAELDVVAKGTNWALVKCTNQYDIDDYTYDHSKEGLNDIIPMSNPGDGSKISDARAAWEKLSDDIKKKLVELIQQ